MSVAAGRGIDKAADDETRARGEGHVFFIPQGLWEDGPKLIDEIRRLFFERPAPD